MSCSELGETAQPLQMGQACISVAALQVRPVPTEPMALPCCECRLAADRAYLSTMGEDGQVG